MENKIENTQNIAKKIEEAIKNKKIKMKPRWYFILKSVLVLSLFLILLLITFYLSDFVFLIFHEYNKYIDKIVVLEFLKVVPLILVLLIIVFLFSLYKLIHDYSFVYRKNILYVILCLLLAIVVILINVNIFLDKDFKFARFGEKAEVPFLQNIHKYYLVDKMPKKIHGLLDKEKIRDFQKKDTIYGSSSLNIK